MLTVEQIPIGQLYIDPANARRHPVRNLDAIKASLVRFGQQKPIGVDEKNVVRVCRCPLEAARAPANHAGGGGATPTPALSTITVSNDQGTDG